MTADNFYLGFDFGGTKIALGTGNADGGLLQRCGLPTLAEGGAEQAVARALQSARLLVQQTRTGHGGELAGVGVATMGVTLEDRVVMAPNVPGWDRLALPGMMRTTFGTAVRVENDVKAAASAELKWGALTGVEVGIYLNLGTGIAAALIVDGRVVRGAHGAAGEIAYNLRYLDEAAGVRQERAPLEEFVGGGAIARRAKLQFGDACSPQELFDAVERDPAAREFVDAILLEIAFHLTNLTIALDPSRVVVGGGMLRSKHLVLPRLVAHLERFVPFPPEVVEAYFSLDAGLKGGLALAVDAAQAT